MTSYIVPLFILFVLIIGIIEKKNVYELFIEGVISGIKVVYNIFPYIFAISILSGVLRECGILNSNYTVLPLLVMKPLSGGASTSIVIDIFKYYGADSFVGTFSSIIMASTETTLYVIGIMSSKVKITNMKIVVVCGLIGDFVAVVMGIILAKYLV